MFKELFESKVIFPLPELSKSKDFKKAQILGKKYNVILDKTWDSANPDDFKFIGKTENIKRFLKAMNKEYLLTQFP